MELESVVTQQKKKGLAFLLMVQTTVIRYGFEKNIQPKAYNSKTNMIIMQDQKHTIQEPT